MNTDTTTFQLTAPSNAGPTSFQVEIPDPSNSDRSPVFTAETFTVRTPAGTIIAPQNDVYGELAKRAFVIERALSLDSSEFTNIKDNINNIQSMLGARLSEDEFGGVSELDQEVNAAITAFTSAVGTLVPDIPSGDSSQLADSSSNQFSSAISASLDAFFSSLNSQQIDEFKQAAAKTYDALLTPAAETIASGIDNLQQARDALLSDAAEPVALPQLGTSEEQSSFTPLWRGLVDAKFTLPQFTELFEDFDELATETLDSITPDTIDFTRNTLLSIPDRFDLGEGLFSDIEEVVSTARDVSGVATRADTLGDFKEEITELGESLET